MSIKLYNQAQVQTQTKPISGYGLYDRENNPFNLEPGDVLNATVSYKNKDKAVLTMKDSFSFEVSSASIKGEVGDELTFQVIKSGKGNIALKQLIDQPEGYAKAAGKNGAFGKLIEIFKQSSLIRETDSQNPAVDQETQAKTAKAVSKIKRQMAYASDSLNQSAVRELIKSGVSLQKISLHVLNSISHEIDKKPEQTLSPEELAKRAAELGIQERSVGEAQQIVKALHDHGLPVRDRHVAALQNVLAMAEKTGRISPSAAAKLIKDEKPVTLENMYIYEYSAKDIAETDNLSREEWAALEPQLDQLFDREGIDRTKEAYEAAKFLLKNDLPVNKENINKALYLLFSNQKIDREEILDRAAASLSAGKSPSDIMMMEPSQAKERESLLQHYQSMIKELPYISGDTVERLLKRQIPLTLQNLRDARETERQANSQYSALGEDVSVTRVTAKRRLAEIQLKLTREAAVRLAGKGVNIDTMPLEEAVEALRDVEREGYAAKLRMTGGEASSEKIGRMTSLYDKLWSLQPLTNNVFGDILTKRIDFNIEDMHQSKQAAQVMSDLEAFATAPSRRHGDSFRKVRAQFDGLLTELGIEATDENVRAAVILSRSQVDINQENIDRTKLIDDKINTIVDKLHPTIAASIINEGLNPAEMHVDEVLAYIDRFNDMFGHDLKDKIAGHILALDNNKSIDPDDRDKLIAVYRMLNLIQKNDGAAIGVALKASTSLTLGGLMESGKYYQRGQGTRSLYNVSIDDNFGSLSQIHISDHKISHTLEKEYHHSFQQLQPAEQAEAERIFAEENLGRTEKNLLLYAQANETNQGIAGLGYQAGRLEELIWNADPAILSKWMNEGVDIVNTPVEELTQMLRDEMLVRNAAGSNPGEAEEQRFMQQIQDMLEASPMDVYDMESRGIPTTLPLISAYHSMFQKPFHLGDSLNKLNTEQPEADLDEEIVDTSLTELKAGETPTDMLNRLQDKLEDVRENTFNEKLLTQLDLIQNAIKVQNFTGRTQDGFSLPLKLHDKITNLNMLVLNDKLSEAGRGVVLISLETDRLGTVQAYLTMDRDEMTIDINTNRLDGLEALQSNAVELKAYLQEVGVKLADLRFGIEEKIKGM